MKEKKTFYGIIRIIFIFIIIAVIFFIVSINLIKNNCNNEIDNIYTEYSKNEIQYQEDISVEEIKNEVGYTGESSLYNIDTEYDGRKVLNIKAELQYKVAFVGIIKQDKFEMSEIDEVFNENYPTKNGIWIEKTNRKKIYEIINENTLSDYKIGDEGYLEIENQKEQNNNDIILEKIINSDERVILTINSFYYELDNINGEIVEYPFEKLDSYQPFDLIKSEKNTIIVLSSNKANKLKNSQIFEEMLLTLEQDIIK